MKAFNVAVLAVQEHRYVHEEEDPDIISHILCSATLFTSSATRNTSGAAIHGVGIAVKSELLPLITSVNKVNDRIVSVVFKGNPKTYVISCYSPQKSRLLSFTVSLVTTSLQYQTMHLCLYVMLCHNITNRNGQHLLDFLNQHNL